MTVVFAFASKTNHVGFIGTDNLESHGLRSADKLVWVFGRFAVACFGADVVLDALRYVAYFDDKSYRDGTRAVGPGSAQELGRSIVPVLVELAPVRYEAFKRSLELGGRSAGQLKDLHEQTGNLVVLDAVELRVFHIFFGKIYPPSKTYKSTCNEAKEERVWRYAISSPEDIGEVTSQIYSDPFGWCATAVGEARAELNAKGILGRIGDLGSCFICRGGERELRSTFDSPKDFAKRSMGARTNK